MLDAFPVLADFSKMVPADLLEAGCARWSEPDERGNTLWLFPKEWYPTIPDGFEITDIFNNRETFKGGETDGDYRGGMLSFGVLVPEPGFKPAAPQSSSSESGDAQIRRAAKEAAPSAQVARSEGDLLVYYAGFNLSKFVRFLALQPYGAGTGDAAQTSGVQIDDPNMCQDCFGDGYFPKEDLTGDVKCEACNGTGSRPIAQQPADPDGHVLVLSPDAYNKFIEACKNPAEPTEALKEMFRKYGRFSEPAPRAPRKELLGMLDYLENAARVKATGFVAPEVKIHNMHVENFAAEIREALSLPSTDREGGK